MLWQWASSLVRLAHAPHEVTDHPRGGERKVGRVERLRVEAAERIAHQHAPERYEPHIMSSPREKWPKSSGDAIHTSPS